MASLAACSKRAASGVHGVMDLAMDLVKACCHWVVFWMPMTEPWWRMPWRVRFWPAPASFLPEGATMSWVTGFVKQVGDPSPVLCGVSLHRVPVWLSARATDWWMMR